jgi:hypothetical protein
MKKTSYILSLAVTTIFLFVNACSKSNDSANAPNISANNNMALPVDTAKVYDVVYAIKPYNHIYQSILYIDSSGKIASADKPGDFANGIKKVTVKGQAFNIWVFTLAGNSTPYELDYTLSITVNGALKISKDCAVPPYTPQLTDSVAYDLSRMK